VKTKLVCILTFTTAYSIIRYNICGPVSPENIPVFILNKSISFAATACLFPCSLNAFKANAEKVRQWGRASYYLALAHVLLSLPIYTPEYFAKLFNGRMMNIWGEMMILAGVLCFLAYWQIPKAFHILNRLHSLHLYASALLGAHVFFLGVRGWSDFGGWYGGMPPISMITFMLAALSFLYFSLAKFKKVDLTRNPV
jgi:hypothetical protein